MHGLFLHFINRVINPVVLLESEADINRFLATERDFEEKNEFYQTRYEPIGFYYQQMYKKTRVIALFHDKGEYSNELRLFQEAAQALAGRREDLRIGLVTDRALVKAYKAKYGPKWFDEYSLNTMVLQREPGNFAFYDFEQQNIDIRSWINKKSLNKNGDPITRETAFIANDIYQPIVYLYIDRNDPSAKADSKVALDAY